MPANLSVLCDDLMIETDALDQALDGLRDDDWTKPTPAEGWSIHDQVTHLAYFDEAAILAATAPQQFRSERDAALRDIDGFTSEVAQRYRGLTRRAALQWWRERRRAFVHCFASLDPTTRLPWYGPDMSAASAITARIMETWAHGQDVADALETRRTPTPALRHVAHLGVRTFENSFRAQGRKVPDVAIRVELTAAGGEVWEWGDEGAVESIRGPALDFCLVVTQRRHVDDCDLRVHGRTANEWVTIAQAFAGPSGRGRKPGQFASVQ